MGKKRAKKLVITAGILALTLFAPVHNNPLGEFMGTITNTIEAQAAELTQSARWEGSGDTWRVKAQNGGGYIKNCWFQDDVTGHWYLLGDGDGSLMYAGLVTDKSTGKTYLLNTEHDGTYGRMLSIDGQYMVNGKSVYLTFNQNHDGTFGAITSGLSEVRSTGVKESTRDSIPTDNAEEITEQPNIDAEITDNAETTSNTETEYSEDTNEYGTGGFYDPIFGWVDTSGIETIGHGNKTNTKWE